MKLIFSRKGFDDKYGGIPSVVWPDTKEMISFPIPVRSPETGCSADSLKFRERPLDSILTSLGYDWQKHGNTFHLDPMIQSLGEKIQIGAFGQSGAALGHLKNNDISSGDIFLFFGTFCETYFDNDRLCWFRMYPFHALWGYLVIDSYFDISADGPDCKYRSLSNHPHIQNRKLYHSDNRIYLGNDFGTFRYDEDLRLSKKNFKKSIWELPKDFRESKISHVKLCPIQKDHPKVDFETSPIGQEFVLASPNDGIMRWLESILEKKIT